MVATCTRDSSADCRPKLAYLTPTPQRSQGDGMQGFIQDFLLRGGDIVCECSDKTLLSLGGSGGMPPLPEKFEI